MTAKLIDGKQIANNLLEELKQEITKRQQDGIRNPALAVVYSLGMILHQLYTSITKEGRVKRLALNLYSMTSLPQQIRVN